MTAVTMTTTVARPGEKRPATARWDWHYNQEWFPAGQHRQWEEPGQLADVYARHTGVFALDVDAYKDGKAEAWEQSATGKHLACRQPYVVRGTGGSMRFLVHQAPEQAARWHPVGGRMPWGEIRSAGIGPSPGSTHPSGDLYEAVPGPDAVNYPDGQVIRTNVIPFDDGLQAALEADGAHDRDDREMTAGDADLPDDDGRCPTVWTWFQDARLGEATSPRGETANAAVNYLKRMDAEGHHLGGWIDEVIAALPYTSEDDFAGMWATAPVPAGTTPTTGNCSCGTPFLNGQVAEVAQLPDLLAGQVAEVAQLPDLLAGIRTGSYLNTAEFAPLRWHVGGLVPEGFSLLVGAPKAGKSWLTLGWLLDLAKAGRAVLYLALEDSDRRMQSRCRTVLGSEPIPDTFAYLTVVQPGALIATVWQFVQAHYDEAPLIVLDTLGKAQQDTPRVRDESAYDRDYRITGELQRVIKDCPGAGLIACHHDRKATSEDFIDKASGTRGITGGPDTILVLLRPRLADEGALLITGRDVDENEYALTFAGGRWSLVGGTLQVAAAEMFARRARDKLGDRSASIVAYVGDNTDEGVRAADVAAGLGISEAQAKVYLKRLCDAGRIKRAERGLYTSVSSVIFTSPAPPAHVTNNGTNTIPLSNPPHGQSRPGLDALGQPLGYPVRDCGQCTPYVPCDRHRTGGHRG